MRLLVAYDGSGDARTALDALQKAGLPVTAEAVVISVAEEYLAPPAGEKKGADRDEATAYYFQKRREQIERELSEANQLAVEAKEKLEKHFPGWTIRTEAVSGSPAREILSKAGQLESDLIVLGAQGLSRTAETGLGSISQTVLSRAKCTVRVARGKSAADSRNLKIAVCFDGSKGSQKAVESVAARNWKAASEIGVFVVTDLIKPLVPGRVFQVLPGLREEGLEGERKWVGTFAENVLKTLREAGFFTSLRVYSGNPRLVLPDKTREWNADLIVAGARSSAPECSALGPVALALAARAHCTVEIVR